MIEVIMSVRETIWIKILGVVRAPTLPIFYANSIEVNFNKKRLPSTVPSG